MTVFYGTLLSTFLFGLCSRFRGEKLKANRYLFVFIIISIFILVAGLRANIGDTYVYIEGYEKLADFSGFTEDWKDKGFTIFQLFLYKISEDPQFMIFVTSFITQFCILYTLYKYRSYYELEVFMYITCGVFLVTMNGIRQAMVGAILFFCTKLIIDGKFLPYAIITGILSTMHASALIMIPIYFIVRQKSWDKNTFIIISVSSIVFIFFYQIIPSLFDALQNTTYAEYEDLMIEDGIGSSFTRVLVSAVPVVLSYLYRNILKEKWPESNVFVNMSLINFIFTAYGMYNWIFVRFQLYFQYYNIVLIPYIIKNCIKDRSVRDLIYYLFIVCYFIFFYYEQVIGGVGLGYRSNFINW